MASALTDCALGWVAQGGARNTPFAFVHIASLLILRLQRCPGIIQNRKCLGNKHLSFILSHAGVYYLDCLGPGTEGFASRRETKAQTLG